MTGWTESTLRGAASWQAFKEGKALFEAGTATVAYSTPAGFQGSVRIGNRLVRVSVVIHSPTAIETRCACPANQASGAVCAHAIAVGLAALQPAAAGVASNAPVTAPPSALALEILLPPNWSAALSRGKLSATLTATTKPSGPTDQALAEWLTTVGAGTKSPLHLPLDGPRLAAFLAALIDHPHIVCGPGREPVEIRADGKIHLQKLTCEAGLVHLVPAPQTHPNIWIADDCWQLAPASLTKIGTAPLPQANFKPLTALLNGRAVDLPVDRFLAQLDSWQEWLQIPSDSWLESLHFIPAPCAVALALDGSLQQLGARLEIRYADCPPVPPGQSTLSRFPRITAPDHCEVRNAAAEERAAASLVQAGFQAVDPAVGQIRIFKAGESVVSDLQRATSDALLAGHCEVPGHVEALPVNSTH